jgi:hypothetical protein
MLLFTMAPVATGPLSPVRPPAGENRADSVRFGGFLDHVSRLADKFIDDAGFANASRAAVLLPALQVAFTKSSKCASYLRGKPARADVRRAWSVPRNL